MDLEWATALINSGTLARGHAAVARIVVNIDHIIGGADEKVPHDWDDIILPLMQALILLDSFLGDTPGEYAYQMTGANTPGDITQIRYERSLAKEKP